MDDVAYRIFDTPIGRCAIAWTARGVCGFWLPQADGTLSEAWIRRRMPGAQPGEPPPAVRQAIAGVGGLLRGERVDLADVPLDLEGIPDFHRRVYELARRIPPGRTRSYGELAAELGDAQLARAVGQALGANPIAVIVPCHRVLAAGGRAGGFSAPGGVATKRRLLEIEQARIGNDPQLF